MGAAASSIASSAVVAAAAKSEQVAQGPLSPFPLEIVDAMLDYLEWREILALLRVNSLFYTAIAWRMINRVRIMERDGVLEMEGQHTESRLFLPARLVSRWLPSFVEQLDLYPHDVKVIKDCDWAHLSEYERHKSATLQALVGPLGRPELPNFRTLRLFFNGVLHTDMPKYEPQVLSCLVLPTRRPETITLRGVPAKALKHLDTLFPMNYCNSLVRQVHVIGPELVGEDGTVNGTIYLNWWAGGRALDTLESVEVVFWTPTGGEWLPIPRSREEEWTHLLQRWFDRMLRTLQMSFIELSGPAPLMDLVLGTPQPRKQPAPRLTIVNAGAISPACYARPGDVTLPDKWASYRAREDAVAGAFDALWAMTLPPTLAGKRALLAQRVRFVSLNDWVQEGKWRGVFDPAEVGLEG
ncbi:uncharacterized protein CcaverHIS019_0607900 [Cutaneotrichosporon cavernicola]|uniref:F-box domain-containing protein n=1 Tax=Cutaneotrichosporon cavernicola TaxID=279322 RepID=A0AA48L9I2_9TREE|nr:uncharacterized protein CcaverHIS019_0607900 [Cutaneotrichosporon cavernicola]BEI94331.1 hypothetical protein CcaverHIS019_0607900 [Cutaneotrichosporon cavernicola]BEJ02108.1 hypothetical protein CcaverHIS631_0607900 [Cutaneotrichosporon cavernicola]BEJ09870.1 hypothetical protein CcaverHIS641_0607850 [Cutaneotrichosporon cavernicola]